MARYTLAWIMILITMVGAALFSALLWVLVTIWKWLSIL